MTETLTSQKGTQLVTDGNTRNKHRFSHSKISFPPKFKAVGISQITLYCMLWNQTKKDKKEN